MAADFRGLSQRAKELLASGESPICDYKERVKGLQAEDLVAFANCETGGAILIGVREERDHVGKTKGVPIGHPIDDDSRLQIMSKALSCNPPLKVEIFVENLASQPFFRIEIPSGSAKPYSTGGGTYKIREDTRNNALSPDHLLKIFLDREAEQFRNRFEQATKGLEGQLENTLKGVENLSSAVGKKVEDIVDSISWADFKATDANDSIESVKAQVRLILDRADKNGRRLRSLVKKVGADDPVKSDAEAEVKRLIIRELAEKPKLLEAAKSGGQLSLELSGHYRDEIEKEELNRLFLEAVSELLAKQSTNPPTPKSPKKRKTPGGRIPPGVP